MRGSDQTLAAVVDGIQERPSRSAPRRLRNRQRRWYCGAQLGELLRTFKLKDIYGSAADGVEKLAPGRAHFFVWDWRRDPRPQLARLKAVIDTALKADLSVRQRLDEVVLVGHSFGGLVDRAALEDPAIAGHVPRALTLGTPYWGAPKAIFPLAAGVETPMPSLMDNFVLTTLRSRD